jgi:hypothetical protein
VGDQRRVERGGAAGQQAGSLPEQRAAEQRRERDQRRAEPHLQQDQRPQETRHRELGERQIRIREQGEQVGMGRRPPGVRGHRGRPVDVAAPAGDLERGLAVVDLVADQPDRERRLHRDRAQDAPQGHDGCERRERAQGGSHQKARVSPMRRIHASVSA